MKKLGIITISYGNNYGNKLQNYAMQEVYKKYDYKVETIKFIPQLDRKKELFRKIKRVKIKNIIFKLYKIFMKKELQSIANNRISNFNKFDKKIKFTMKKYNDNNYQEIGSKYDILSVGSDQVWNPNFSDYSKFYLLDSVQNCKKIAYAPSFGINKLPDMYKQEFKENLVNFSSLTCREKSGAKIIKDLLNIDVPVVLDPTMLLTKEEWDKVKIIPKEQKNKKYILLYFLGGISKNNKKQILRFSKENKCALIDLSDVTSKNYSYGPSEFIGLISNAYAVLTDSFHASVFSSIYHKPFYVFDRNGQTEGKMNSRIENLLSIFKLENRKFNNSFDNLLNVNYSNFEKILKQNQKENYKKIEKMLK